MTSFGKPRRILELIRSDYEIAAHGVSLNIASADPLNLEYLKTLKKFITDFQPFNVSDHLCWTGAHNKNIHDLLPIPYTVDMLSYISEKLDFVQNFLGRQILIENVSSYFTYNNSEMTEWDFLNQLVQKTGCYLLLDINNIYVSAQNHKFSALDFLNQINHRAVKQIHLAGFTDMGDYLFDTHSKPVHEPVWDLFRHFVAHNPRVPFMIEWDEDIPEFPEFLNEIEQARSEWHKAQVHSATDSLHALRMAGERQRNKGSIQI